MVRFFEQRWIVWLRQRMLTWGTVLAVLETATAASAQGSFYEASPQEIAGRPGTLIRSEPMRFAPAGAQAYRVLYRSTGLRDEPIAVSGVIIIPPGPPPAGGRRIVAWAHPTTGIVSRCAPSRAQFVFQQIQGSRDLVERGFTIAATDYPGLGTPGPHPYLVGVSEARAVLDAVRVARSMQEQQGDGSYAVWGHSQGGQAALYSGLIARQYAPELNLLGVAAAAPATELAALLNDDINTDGGRNLTAMTLWSWQRVFGAPMDRVVRPEAIAAIEALAQECIESVYDMIVRGISQRPLRPGLLSVPDVTAMEPWRTLLAENTPGTMPRDIPLFIAQGSADQLVRPGVTRDYAAKSCVAGLSVRLMMMPGVNHGFAATHATKAAVDWIADRFGGVAAPSDCGKI